VTLASGVKAGGAGGERDRAGLRPDTMSHMADSNSRARGAHVDHSAGCPGTLSGVRW